MGAPPATNGGLSQQAIGLLIASAADRELLARLLSGAGHPVRIVSGLDSPPLTSEEVGLFIVDEHCARQYGGALLALKSASEAIFLPLVILLPPSADAAPWLQRGVDDVVRLPLSGSELHARLGVLLRLREQSQAHRKAQEELERRVQERTVELTDAVRHLQEEAEQRSLRESEIRFQARLLDAVEQAVIATDLQGNVCYWNRFAEQLYGWTAAEAIGQNILALTPAEDAEQRAAEIMVRLAQGQSWSGEFPVRRRDGAEFVAAVTDSPIHDDHGALIGVIGVSSDITARKEAEARLRESEARFRAQYQGLPVPTYTWRKVGDDLELIDFNEAARTLTRGRIQELIDMRASQMYPDSPDIRENMERCLIERSTIRQELKYRLRSTGQLKDLSVSYVHIPPDIVMVHTTDVTHQKETEAAIQRLNAELEERVLQRTAELAAANRELESFSYSVSHDLRAPLRSINGFTRTVLEDYSTQLDAEARRYLERVAAAANRMGVLTDALLSLAHLMRSEMRRESIDLSALVWQIAVELQSADEDRMVRFEIQDGLTAEGDPRLLLIVLDNLVGNAWKFTRGKEPAIIRFGAEEREGQQVYFVQDNGAGFDMQYAGKLFGAFQRLHSPQEFEGTGIGLTTVHRIIERHGGQVWAEARVNEGAAFYFTLQPAPVISP